ncbi:MAG TPA: hypothetical protein VJ304_07840, partial [Flavobacterium sp.]|nr:hypothetical protein [Flavobacterium sp.]
MRQRLINKTEPKGTLLKSSNALSKNTIVADAISLQTLLFDSKISKEDWLEGLKYHSKTLTGLLLNSQIEEFNQYLGSQFASEIVQPISFEKLDVKSAPSTIKKGLSDMDYRPVLQD